MRFPWSKNEQIEHRQDSYTNTLINAIVSRSGGGSLAVPSATAAVEACSSLVARAFAAAEVKAPAAIQRVLTPALLSMIGRAMIQTGDLAIYISVDERGLMLSPASGYTVTGPYIPDAWRYQIHLPGPSEQTTVNPVTPDSVLHFKYQIDPARPWKGVGPIQAAKLAGSLSANTIAALADEAGGPHGFLMPVSQADTGLAGDENDPLASLRADLNSLKGNLALVESQRGVFSTAAGSEGPRSDEYEVKRIGSHPPDSLINQARLASDEIYSACGMGGLFDTGQTESSRREAWRQTLFSTIAPLARLVEAELREKLDADITLGFSELRASDIQGRSRALGAMVKAGMALDKAERLTGLTEAA